MGLLFYTFYPSSGRRSCLEIGLLGISWNFCWRDGGVIELNRIESNRREEEEEEEEIKATGVEENFR